MANDNFGMLILIAIIVFLLFTLNQKEYFFSTSDVSEGYESAVPGSAPNSIQSTSKQLLNQSASNAAPQSITDIFKNTNIDVNSANIPAGLQSNTRSAAFNNNLGDSMTPSNDLVKLINNKTNTLTSSDLLPGKDTKANDFNTFKITASYMDSNLANNAVNLVGIDTIGSSKKFGSTDIRGNVPCPKFAVSPWNNSTADPDTNNKGFC